VVFYLSLPLLILIFRLKQQSGLWRIVFWCAALALDWFAAFHTQLIMFILGIILWEIHTSQKMNVRLNGIGEVLTITALIFSAGLFSPVVGFSWAYSPYIFLFFSVSVFAGALYTVRYEGVLKKFFSNGLLRRFGEISYSFYLIHAPVLQGIRLGLNHMSLHIGFLCEFFLCFGLSTIAAVLLFVLVERPFSMSRREEGNSGLAGLLLPGFFRRQAPAVAQRP